MEYYVKTALARKINEFKLTDFESLSSDDNLTLETLALFPMEDWDWYTIIHHPNFTFDWVRKLWDAPWPWMNIHECPVIARNTWTSTPWFREMIDKPLNFHDLSRYVDMVAIAVDFPHKPWNWAALSRNASVHVLIKHRDLPWDWSEATVYGPCTVRDICDNPTLPWDHTMLSFTEITERELVYIRTFKDAFDELAWRDFSSSVSWSIAKKNMDLPWVFAFVHFDSVLDESDFEMIQDVGYTNWNWKNLSEWVHIDVVIKYPWYPWNPKRLIRNQTLEYKHLKYFGDLDNTLTPCKSLGELVHEWTSATKIQRAWRMCAVNPEYVVCRKNVTAFIESFNLLFS